MSALALGFERVVAHVDAKWHIPIATVALELLRCELEGDEGNMGVVHCLESLYISARVFERPSEPALDAQCPHRYSRGFHR